MSRSVLWVVSLLLGVFAVSGCAGSGQETAGGSGGLPGGARQVTPEVDAGAASEVAPVPGSDGSSGSVPGPGVLPPAGAGVPVWALQLRGLPVDEALELARDRGVPARVVSVDGQGMPGTMDLVPGRLNLSVRSGVVVDVMVEAPGKVAR